MATKFLDLHLHLDGAITLDIAKKLAKLQNIELPCSSDIELNKLLTLPSDCASLVDFLKCFAFPLTLLQTSEGIEEAVYLVLEEAKSHGVIYAEVRFAPQLHCDKGLSQEDAINAAIKGLKRSSIKGGLILCCMRGEGNDKENDLTVDLAKKYLVKTGGVVAIDLAGAESIWPTSKYIDLFKKAKALDIPFTIHSGESEGPEGVKLALELGAKRIGHGVRIREDKEVVELVKKSGVTLEMCPTSNFQTCAISSLDDYPLLDYYKYGIKVTLNTDDPAIEGTSIDREFSLMEKHIGLTEKIKKELIKQSISAAFADEKTKEYLYKEIDN